MWPNGMRLPHTPSATGDDNVFTDEEKRRKEENLQCLRSVLARAKLIGSVPDELRRVLGSRPTMHGMARLSCNSQTLE